MGPSLENDFWTTPPLLKILQVKTTSWPSAAARMDEGDRALRLEQARGPSAATRGRRCSHLINLGPSQRTNIAPFPPGLGLSQYTIFGPPHPINFVHDHLFFSKFIIIYFFVIQGQVRLRYFLGRALRPRVRLVKTLSGPSAVARTGQGAERCGHRLG